MVINKKGFFEDTIKTINRKTAAIEMESYGVARACIFANEGKTKPIIFKSVMDKTFDKEDVKNNVNNKKFAAYTSALFLKSLFEEKIIL
jgi:nucleoside phosphorylase